LKKNIFDFFFFWNLIFKIKKTKFRKTNLKLKKVQENKKFAKIRRKKNQEF